MKNQFASALAALVTPSNGLKAVYFLIAGAFCLGGMYVNHISIKKDVGTLKDVVVDMRMTQMSNSVVLTGVKDSVVEMKSEMRDRFQRLEDGRYNDHRYGGALVTNYPHRYVSGNNRMEPVE